MKIKFIILVTVLISILISCEKDEEEYSSTLKNTHRIKQIVQIDSGEFDVWKSDYLYEGEKLVKVINNKIDESGNWNEIDKVEITYSGNNASTTRYYKESGNWKTLYKSEYIFQNELIIKQLRNYYRGEAWITYVKVTYQYSGNNISTWQEYFDLALDGNLKQKSKGEYIYQKGKLTEYKSYELDDTDNWHQNIKRTFFYEGNNLILYYEYYKEYYHETGRNYKVEYLFSGDVILQKGYYHFNIELNQWESTGYESYTYNSNGYLIEVLQDNGNKTTFEYEEGHGNAKLFLYPPGSFISGEPTLKSASLYGIGNDIAYY